MKLKDLLEIIAPLPWKLDGTAITDGGPNIIAVCSKGWSDDKANTAYLHHAANVLPGLVNAVREYTREREYQNVSACKKDQDRLEKLLLAELSKAEEVEMENEKADA